MKFSIKILLFLSFFILNNCAITFQNILDGLNYSKTSADFLSFATTKKTTSDHALSYLFNKDCSLGRSLKFKAICEEIRKKDFIRSNDLVKNKDIKIVNVRKIKKKKKKLIVPSMAY